jgi:quercetin dioxygenase-like cupin family protein
MLKSKRIRFEEAVPAGLSGSLCCKVVPVVVVSFYKVNVETKADAPVQEEGAEGVKIKWLLDKSVGTPTFAMRHFSVQPGGHTPLHKHDWEHEVYVLEGEGFVKHQDQEYSIRCGDAIFVPPNELHQFRSTESKHLRFLCMVPL